MQNALDLMHVVNSHIAVIWNKVY